jgi:HPt (histidine-containing phosphotransfer) domain-containing protein
MSVTSDPAFRQVIDRFVQRAASDRQTLAQLVSRPAPLAAEDMAMIQHLVHRLAGTAGTFGFAQLSRVARDLDGLLRQHCVDSAAMRDGVQKVLMAIDEGVIEA